MNEAPRAEGPGDDAVPISMDLLSAEALQAVVEEFVTRDGTELTDASRKAEQVMAQLSAGHAELWYDPRSRSCSIHPAS